MSPKYDDEITIEVTATVQDFIETEQFCICQLLGLLADEYLRSEGDLQILDVDLAAPMRMQIKSENEDAK